jgi:hypothetical protein
MRGLAYTLFPLTYTHALSHTHSHIHTLTFSHTHPHTHSLTHTHTHPHTRTHTHTLTHILTHTPTHTQVDYHIVFDEFCPYLSVSVHATGVGATSISAKLVDVTTTSTAARTYTPPTAISTQQSIKVTPAVGVEGYSKEDMVVIPFVYGQQHTHTLRATGGSGSYVWGSSADSILTRTHTHTHTDATFVSQSAGECVLTLRDTCDGENIFVIEAVASVPAAPRFAPGTMEVLVEQSMVRVCVFVFV